MSRKAPEIIEVKTPQLEELLDRAEANTLRQEDTELLRQILGSYVLLFEMVGDKRTTIARLRKLLFGAATEKADQILPADEGQAEPHASGGQGANRSRASEPDEGEPERGEPSPGHGRYGAEAYQGGRQVYVAHADHRPGDDCPECRRGTLYDKCPAVVVRIVGQAPLQATVYRLQRLRCHLCGQVFTASLPEGVGEEKYDHTVASIIGLLKYGSGLPFNRLQRLQGNCEIPLAASTQWEIVSAAAELFQPAYEELVRQAAQGDVVYNDDTTVKILELMGKRAAKSPPRDDPHDPGRTGLFTSGVVATRGGVRLALFLSGRRHAGENLQEVLKRRAAELEAPIQMCDGLSRNLPQEFATIVANCVAHGRRKFVELHDRFPEECRYVIEAFKVIYRHDKIAREQQMSALERLSYHQLHSQSTMDDLKDWLDRQFEEKRVEPNSSLGEAIRYLRKRWDALTLFLRKAGAPLDNNVCERALKKAILHRKNSLFYKTRNGAHVGDVYMSLIYTCELCGVNALDYLNQLQLHATEVCEHPDRWMPWSYRSALAAV